MKISLALQLATSSASTRTIEGIATFYDVRAHANYPLLIKPGAIELPDPLSQTKLCLEHDTSAVVGYLIDATDSPTELRTKFYVPEGPAGDEALTKAANGLRDGLSVGLDLYDNGYTFDQDGYLIITSGKLREVSLTGVPAMDDARLSDVVASLRSTSTKGNPMQCSTCGQVHAAGLACSAPAPAAAAAPVAPVAPAAPATVPTSAAAGQAPALQIVERGTVMTMRAAANLISDTIRRGGSASDVKQLLGISAALADVVPANDAGLGFTRPVWLGELWKASQERRPFIDTFGPTKPLTGIKAQGWQWDVLPEVVDYAGNKAAVVGNAVSTKPVEATAERTAGGWDMDRIYVDLGDPGLIEALFEAATADYRRKSEAKVVAKLVAGASSVAAQLSLPAALGALGMAAAALGAGISAVGFGSGVWSQFLGLTRDQVPWWMGSGDTINLGTVDGNVGGMRLFLSSSLAATEVLGADSRAATIYEVDPPVRVQAVDLAKGGIDLGVFGYTATIINDARALIKTTVTPTP